MRVVSKIVFTIVFFNLIFKGFIKIKIIVILLNQLSQLKKIYLVRVKIRLFKENKSEKTGICLLERLLIFLLDILFYA